MNRVVKIAAILAVACGAQVAEPSSSSSASQPAQTSIIEKVGWWPSQDLISRYSNLTNINIPTTTQPIENNPSPPSVNTDKSTDTPSLSITEKANKERSKHKPWPTQWDEGVIKFLYEGKPASEFGFFERSGKSFVHLLSRIVWFLLWVVEIIVFFVLIYVFFAILWLFAELFLYFLFGLLIGFGILLVRR